MSVQTVNILAIVLGFLGVIIVFIAILAQVYLSKWTNKMIEKEDERAKGMVEEANKRMQKLSADIMKMIDEGNKRLERILLEIDKSTKEILAEVLKKVST